jgi:hypothetical protein
MKSTMKERERGVKVMLKLFVRESLNSYTKVTEIRLYELSSFFYEFYWTLIYIKAAFDDKNIRLLFKKYLLVQIKNAHINYTFNTTLKYVKDTTGESDVRKRLVTQSKASGSACGEFEDHILLVCSAVHSGKIYRRFRGACCLHNQDDAAVNISGTTVNF